MQLTGPAGLWLSGSIFGGNFIHNKHTTTTKKNATTSDHDRRRGVGRRKNTYPPDLKKMRCVGVMGGLGGQVNVSYQSKSDRFTTPENQASRLSLIPPTPLSRGLVID